MRPNLVLGALTLLLYFAGSTLGEECIPSTSDPEVAVAGQYVDNDFCQFEDDPCLFSIWHYQESNDIDGLQRGDEVVDNTCGGLIDADTIICGLLPAGFLSRRREDARRANGACLAGVAMLGAVAFLPTAEAC